MSSEDYKKISQIIHNDLLTRHFKNADPNTYALLNRYFSFHKRRENYDNKSIGLASIPILSLFIYNRTYRVPKFFPKFIRNNSLVFMLGIMTASSMGVAALYRENRERKNLSDHNFTDSKEFENEPIKTYRKIYFNEYKHRYNHLCGQVFYNIHDMVCTQEKYSPDFDFSTRDLWPSDLGFIQSPLTQDVTKSFEEILEEQNKRGGSSCNIDTTVKKPNNEYKSFEEIWAKNRK